MIVWFISTCSVVQGMSIRFCRRINLSRARNNSLIKVLWYGLSMLKIDESDKIDIIFLRTYVKPSSKMKFII